MPFSPDRLLPSESRPGQALRHSRAQLPRAEVVDDSQASRCLVHGILHESVLYVSTSGSGPFGNRGLWRAQ